MSPLENQRGNPKGKAQSFPHRLRIDRDSDRRAQRRDNRKQPEEKRRIRLSSQNDLSKNAENSEQTHSDSVESYARTVTSEDTIPPNATSCLSSPFTSFSGSIMTDHSRRKFLHASAASAAAALTFPSASSAAASSASNELCVFSKPLQHLSYEALAELAAEMGFAGIEGTVRQGGHVEPSRVEEDLPKQIEALKKSGVAMTIMTTDVNTADSELHRRVIKTAAALGVKRFRMGSIKYDSNTPLPGQIEEIKKTFKELVAFCQPLGIRPLYQNHAGAGRFGSGLWDLYQVLETLPADSSGVTFDIRHATVEGGQSWPTEFQLMRPHIGMVYCKDCIWETGNKRPVNVPLGTGRVDYPAFIKLLKKSKYDGPISLHMEYKDHKDPSLLKESIAAIRADKKALDALLAG